MKWNKVLVTGGIGSFGREMADRLRSLGCGHIRILSRDEAKQEAMRIENSTRALRFHDRKPASVRRRKAPAVPHCRFGWWLASCI